MGITESLDSSICPSCGKEEPLNELVGFCKACTKQRFPHSAVCENCGKIEPRGQFRKLCNYCQRNKWFSENADAIESYMRAGLTYGMAVVKVLFDNRPSCFSCGRKIKGGKKGKDLFCTSTVECKREARYYKFLILNKGKNKQEALEIISERITDRGKALERT